jgi:pimeloyl-ACP methyl ester carboxylesterase
MPGNDAPVAEPRTISEIRLDGKAIELLHYQQPASRGTIVLLHEALGSVSYWKEFPETLAAATGHSIIAYSRAGHGNSQGPVEPRSLDYYRKQVDIVLPAILKHFNISEPVLYGHSEGAGIAMLYAATKHPVRAIIAECPIVVSEEQTANTIRQLEAGYEASDMSARLGRYHANPDEVFYSWIQSNRSSFFREFPFEQYLKAIECPLLVLQGSHDEFGGIAQYQEIHRSLPLAQHAVFDAGHLLHREQPELVASTVSAFVQTLPHKASALRPSSQPQSS